MILFVNACVRPQSGTKRLAQSVLRKLGGDVKEVDLEREKVSPLNGTMLERRLRVISAGAFDDPMFDLAKDFAAAEKIVIAAPYWDLSFPALLKCYIEQISVIGLTFAYDDTGRPYGLCKADRLIYVTTSGGPMFNEDAGFGAISNHWLKIFTAYEMFPASKPKILIWSAPMPKAFYRWRKSNSLYDLSAFLKRADDNEFGVVF